MTNETASVDTATANAALLPADHGLSNEELNSRTQTMVGLPLGLRLAIREFGPKQDPKMSEAAVMRNAIAAFIGYELPASKERVSKYDSPEAAKAAQKARQKDRRQTLQATLKRFSSAVENAAEDDEDDADDDETDEVEETN
jgi:hypothetical protein